MPRLLLDRILGGLLNSTCTHESVMLAIENPMLVIWPTRSAINSGYWILFSGFKARGSGSRNVVCEQLRSAV